MPTKDWRAAGSRAVLAAMAQRGLADAKLETSSWHPHDLRHVAACSMLFDVGLDPALAAQMLGRANAAFTLSRYVGVRKGAEAMANNLTDRW